MFSSTYSGKSKASRFLKIWWWYSGCLWLWCRGLGWLLRGHWVLTLPWRCPAAWSTKAAIRRTATRRRARILIVDDVVVVAVVVLSFVNFTDDSLAFCDWLTTRKVGQFIARDRNHSNHSFSSIFWKRSFSETQQDDSIDVT